MNIWKKVLITTAAVSVLSFHTHTADAETENELRTVYHVYINGDRVGTVDDVTIIEKEIDEKIESYEKKFGKHHFSVDNVTYITEKVFRPVTTNKNVVSKLSSDIKVVADATAILINDQPVAYVKNQQSVEEVIKKLKLKYVSEKQLAELEMRKETGKELTPLKEGASRILDVQLSEKVSSHDAKISPEKILTVDEAVKLIEKGTLKEEKYKVKEGDVLIDIAKNHKMKVKDLLALNPGLKEDSFLQIGQELNVTANKPYLHVIVQEEGSKKEEIPFETEIIEDSSMYKGDNKTKQEGQTGEKLVHYIVVKQNGKEMKREMQKEKVLKEPVKQIIVKGTKVVPSRGTGNLAWPTVGGYVSSKMGTRWGKFHKGIDIARPSSYTIKAADNGVVVEAGWDGGYGKKIVINHNNGLKTVYAHLSSINVRVGQTVEKGQKIGVMGSTGHSTGTHLHFEVHKNGRLQNPLNYLR
jgi:murein DD-endopeptidase MepM/ murein hydrolase activator NlpD